MPKKNVRLTLRSRTGCQTLGTSPELDVIYFSCEEGEALKDGSRIHCDFKETLNGTCKFKRGDCTNLRARVASLFQLRRVISAELKNFTLEAGEQTDEQVEADVLAMAEYIRNMR